MDREIQSGGVRPAGQQGNSEARAYALRDEGEGTLRLRLMNSVAGLQGEGEEDLFVFNDTIDGPRRAPVVKPGRVTQA